MIEMNAESVCIQNDHDEYIWINKESPKIRPHPLYKAQKPFFHEIRLRNPPILPCEPNKCIHYHSKSTDREYVLCCTEWNTFCGDKEHGVYRYHLEHGWMEYLSPYPVDALSVNHFDVAMDHNNEQLHIYCFAVWSILDIGTKRWSFTDSEDAMKFNLMDIQPSRSIVVDGQLYLFGEGRFARYCSEILSLSLTQILHSSSTLQTSCVSLLSSQPLVPPLYVTVLSSTPLPPTASSRGWLDSAAPPHLAPVISKNRNTELVWCVNHEWNI